MTRYQPFNDLPAAQFQALVKDVERNGVLIPIVVDENDRTIDGHQRRRAAAEAHVDCPRIVIAGLDEDEKRNLAITLNLFRRHLSGVERSKALQELANLGMSTRRIGEALGMPKSTVHDSLRQLSGSGQLDRPERVEGADGKSRPATMPKRVDAETGEILSGTDQSAPADAAGPEKGAPKTREVPTPAPKVGGAEGYRATATSHRDRTRQGLLTLDPERVVKTADEPDHWRQFSEDMRRWLDDLDGHLAGPRLKVAK